MVYLENNQIEIGESIIAWHINGTKVEAFTAIETNHVYIGHMDPDGFIYIGQDFYKDLYAAREHCDITVLK